MAPESWSLRGQPTTWSRFGVVLSCSGSPLVTTTVPPTFTRCWPLQAFGSKANDMPSRSTRSRVPNSTCMACRKLFNAGGMWSRLKPIPPTPAKRRYAMDHRRQRPAVDLIERLYHGAPYLAECPAGAQRRDAGVVAARRHFTQSADHRRNGRDRNRHLLLRFQPPIGGKQFPPDEIAC